MSVLTNLIIGLILGYLLANNMPNKPIHFGQYGIGPNEEIIQPAKVDPREMEYMKDCTGFGYSKEQCSAIWHDKAPQ